jgi:hypothetical protein
MIKCQDMRMYGITLPFPHTCTWPGAGWSLGAIFPFSPVQCGKCVCVSDHHDDLFRAPPPWTEMYKIRVIAVQAERLSEVRLVALRSVLIACPLSRAHASLVQYSCCVYGTKCRTAGSVGARARTHADQYLLFCPCICRLLPQWIDDLFNDAVLTLDTWF